MQITIINVSAPSTPAGKKYQVIEVAYKDESGKVNSRKIMSFANPQVFKDLQGFVNGDVVDVTAVKEGDYWQWKAVKKLDGSAPAQATSSPAKGGKVLGSNYETPEERAKRQVYIIRQSSISSAISALAVGAKSAPSAESILELAKKFEEFVFSEEKETTLEGIDGLIAMDSDIPY